MQCLTRGFWNRRSLPPLTPSPLSSHSALAQPLSNLHYNHLAPEVLRVRSRAFERMDLVSQDALDRPRAVRETPALIKGYLRLGGAVGEGAFVDRAFNTVDVCLVMDTATLEPMRRAIYAKGRA